MSPKIIAFVVAEPAAGPSFGPVEIGFGYRGRAGPGEVVGQGRHLGRVVMTGDGGFGKDKPRAGHFQSGDLGTAGAGSRL